ncbi:MAG: serine hydrolase domain-containing protein [Candidatus Limnocylindria bacterium]
MKTYRGLVPALALVFVLGGCGPAPAATGAVPSVAPTATTAAVTSTAPASAPPTRTPTAFPIAVFAGLRDEPVSEALAAELQSVLDASSNGDGLTATLITTEGTWSGATGLAEGDRPMVPNDQMSIASITKTLVAAQVMQLIEGGKLALRDLAANRLPRDLEFDTNGATIEDLLSMRSGISEYFVDESELLDALTRDRLHVWTLEEKLATVDPKRGPVGPEREWEYIGTNYLLLGLIIEQATGRSVAEVLRSGVLSGDGYERLIYQPDERPTDPMAMPRGASADTFDDGGGYLPSIANATMFTAEGAMASDAPTLARWLRSLCAGQVVSPASLDDMTDLGKRPEYGLGIFDRRYEYGPASGALGHTGYVREGYRTVALCFQNPAMVVVVLANDDEHDVETAAGNLWRAAST